MGKAHFPASPVEVKGLLRSYEKLVLEPGFETLVPLPQSSRFTKHEGPFAKFTWDGIYFLQTVGSHIFMVIDSCEAILTARRVYADRRLGPISCFSRLLRFL